MWKQIFTVLMFEKQKENSRYIFELFSCFQSPRSIGITVSWSFSSISFFYNITGSYVCHLKIWSSNPKILHFSSAYTKCGHRLVLLKLVECSVYIWSPIYWLFGIFLWNCYPVHIFPFFLLPLPGRKNLQNQIQFWIWQTLPVKPIFQFTLPRRERPDST